MGNHCLKCVRSALHPISNDLLLLLYCIDVVFFPFHHIVCHGEEFHTPLWRKQPSGLYFNVSVWTNQRVYWIFVLLLYIALSKWINSNSVLQWISVLQVNVGRIDSSSEKWNLIIGNLALKQVNPAHSMLAWWNSVLLWTPLVSSGTGYSFGLPGCSGSFGSWLDPAGGAHCESCSSALLLQHCDSIHSISAAGFASSFCSWPIFIYSK